MRVAVIGAGIGGLCAAIGMERGGASVDVFERTVPRSRPAGSALSLFANGLCALDDLGVGEALREVTVNSARRFRGGQRRPDGRWLASYPADALSELRVVERAVLHEVLSAALRRTSVHSGHDVLAARPDGTVVVDGPGGTVEERRYDVVVAADGLRSTVRRSWAGDPGTRYAGYAAWRAITTGPVDLHGETGETWGLGRRFGMAPLADGRVYWFASATMPARAPMGDYLAAAQALFGDWHAPIPELLSGTRAEDVQRLPIYRLAGELPSYCQGRVVLLGDAAHAMTPDLGQGGGQAMEDAATLVALLSTVAGSAAPDAETVEHALTAYDAMRRPRSQTIARRSHQVGRVAHLSGRIAGSVRDAAIRLTPDAALGRQLRELQDWTVPTP